MGIRLDQITGGLALESVGAVSGEAAPRPSLSLPTASVPSPASPASVPAVNVDVASSPALEQLQAVVGEINQALQELQTQLNIEFDAESGRAQVIVTGGDGEVLRILPPDEVLEALGTVQAVIGLLLDETG